MPGDMPTLQETEDLGQFHQSKWGECLYGEQTNSIGTGGMMPPSGEEEEDALGRGTEAGGHLPWLFLSRVFSFPRISWGSPRKLSEFLSATGQ